MRLQCALGLKFSRVQFTADLMPSDLVGVSVFERSKRSFRLPPRPGVRAGAAGRRDQPRRPEDSKRAARSHGRAAGVGGKRDPRAAQAVLCHRHAEPERPAGTYPLPESQLDRFLLRITLGYPDRASERALLVGEDRREAITRLPAVMEPGELEQAQRAVREVLASEALLDYLQTLIAATRSGQWFVEGLSPRAGIAVLRVAKARALMAQRDYVAPDDVQAILPQAIAHRLMPIPGRRPRRDRASAGDGRGDAYSLGGSTGWLLFSVAGGPGMRSPGHARGGSAWHQMVLCLITYQAQARQAARESRPAPACPNRLRLSLARGLERRVHTNAVPPRCQCG